MLGHHELKSFLEEAYERFAIVDFVHQDPISVPHQYSHPRDIEIAGFFSAIFSWGNRKTIIAKSEEFMNLMDNSPFDFIYNHREKDRKRFSRFKHRTFQPDDAIFFMSRLQELYRKYDSMEKLFFSAANVPVKDALSSFHKLFFSSEFILQRSKKHISTPAKNSSCKRLNMFLRWMVRKDSSNIDFGIWKSVKPSDLQIPLDIHVYRTATRLQLLKRKTLDWLAVEELTYHLLNLDPEDPVKYDFALFGLSHSAEIMD